MAKAYALSGTNLIAFDTASPTIGTAIAVTGLTAGETLVGIDFRVQNGQLYGLGVNATADTATLYAISATTGVAAVVGPAPSTVTLTSDGTTVVDLPDPATVGYGFDFNPAVDRLRVEAGTLNFRINPNTGSPIDGDNTGLTSGTVTGINPDGATNTGTTTVDAAGYTNNQPNNGGVTTLYTLDAASNSLFIQNPANVGTQTLGQTVTLGGSTLDFTAINGFDVPAGVNATASNTPVLAGSAFAVFNVGGTTGLYSINLVNAQATLLGNAGNGTTAVQGFAVQNDFGGIPAIALSADGANLIRFNTATPGTTTTQAIDFTNLQGGERLVGLDFRPATGQLYALGIDATTDNGSLYLVDPQTGGLTPVGTKGLIAFTTDGATAVDLPDPATAGYGFDFNPAVDRIRVTTSTGLNFRLNPNNGGAIDGDEGGAAGSVTGLNPDGAINGGAVGVSAAAYTNGAGLPTGVTTLYTLDATGDALFIQNPANSGTEGSQVPITLGGAPLDFTDINGFDIPSAVRVATSGSPATGFGYAGLTVGGTTDLFRINLATGVATDLGSVGAGAGATAIAGLALANVANAPPIITTAAAQTVAEGATTVAALTSLDFDQPANSAAFTITGGADAALFAISGGNLVFQAAKNFETQPHTYQIRVSADDGLDVTSTLITVSLANLPPSAPLDVDAASNRVVEGTTAGAAAGVTVASTDPAGGPLTYGLTSSANGAFAVNATTGVVTVADASKIDFGVPGHAYTITATATDGTATVAQNFTIAVVEAATNPVFRFFDTRTGDHFYTTSIAERDSVVATFPTFRSEGSPWETPGAGVATVDVFRFFDRTAGDHFYTTNAAERDAILQTRPDMSFEGVGFQAYANPGREGTFQLERFFNTITGDHHFAASAGEAAGINGGAAGPGWVDEGAAFTVHVPSSAFLV